MSYLNYYAFFVGLGIFVIAYTTYFVLIRSKTPRKELVIFIAFSFLGLYLFSKLLGSLGLWIALGDFFWAPASVLGFHALQIIFWRPWALKHGKTGQNLLRNWSIANPIGQSLGRLGCFFAGCCYIQKGTPFEWPLLEALFLGFVGLFTLLKRKEWASEKLYAFYLYASLSGRFFLDFLRGDHIRGQLGRFSFPQLVCLALILWLFLDSYRRKGHNSGHEIRSRKSRRP